jgi:hypothetical protein
MRAELLADDRYDFGEDSFVEVKIWEVPKPVRGSAHRYKYHLTLVIEGVCVLRYDNEAGKGDHRHIGRKEEPYVFTDLHALTADFWNDVALWKV